MYPRTRRFYEFTTSFSSRMRIRWWTWRVKKSAIALAVVVFLSYLLWSHWTGGQGRVIHTGGGGGF